MARKRSVFSMFVALAALLALSRTAAAQGTGASLLPVGSAAPDFTASTWSGGNTHLSDYKGKIVVLDFWASWCPPCNEAMPHVQEVKDYYGQDIVVLALCISDTADAADAWIRSHHYTMTFALDPAGKGPGSIGHTYKVRSIPTTYVIDRDGRIAARSVTMSEEEVVATIRQLGARTPQEHAQEASLAEAKKEKEDEAMSVIAGEILIIGTVAKDYAGQGPLLLSASSIQTDIGDAHTLPQPRPKTVLVSSGTLLIGTTTPGGAPLHLSAGTSLRVVGKDLGIGKSLTARAIRLTNDKAPAVLPPPAH